MDSKHSKPDHLKADSLEAVELKPKMDRSVGLVETVIEDSKKRKVTEFSDGTKRVDHKNHIPDGYEYQPLLGEGGEGSGFVIQ